MSFNQPVNPSPKSNYTLNPNVATVSPELYAAGARTSLTRDEVNLIEGWSNLKSMHEKLMSMDNKRAAEEFNKLGAWEQEHLKAYYQVDYANKTNSSMLVEDPAKRKALGLENGVDIHNLYKSPFRLLMSMGQTYGQYMNTPYAALQQNLINGRSLSNRGTWEEAFDGKYMYDENEASKLIDKYGGATSFVAMHILAGKTPAEIIDAWGPNDGSILQAIDTMFNDQEKFSSILDDFSYAQMSPGRDVARWINKKLNIEDTAKRKTGGISLTNVGSGLIDFTFQIFADPMTYLTGGTSLIAKSGKAAKLAEAVLKGRTPLEHFAIPEVAKYFDGYSKRIGEYSDALKSKDAVRAAEIKRDIRTNFSEHGTDEEIKLWSDRGVKDLDTFKNQFIGNSPETFAKIVRGRTSSQLFTREGAAFARPTRDLVLGAKQKARELFTGKDNFADIDAKDYSKVISEIQNIGLKESGGADFNALSQVLNANSSKGIRKLTEKMTALHPGSKVVYVDDTKVGKTLDTFRAQAYIALGDKRFADMLTEHFASSNEATRIVLKRGVDQATLHKMGLHGMGAEGQKMIDDILNVSYSSNGSFGAAEKLMRPGVFQPRASDVDGAVTVSGPLHPWQRKNGISALPWRELSEFVAKNDMRVRDQGVMQYMPKLIGGAYNSAATGFLTDIWSLFVLAPMLGIRTAIDEGFMFAMYAKTGMIGDYAKAKRFGRVLTAYTGEKTITGPYRNAVEGVLSKFYGKPIGARRSISEEERMAIRESNQQMVGKGIASYKEADDISRAQIMELAMKKYGSKLSEEHKSWLLDAVNQNPNMLMDTSSANLAQAFMNKKGIFHEDGVLLSPSQLDLALKEFNVDVSDVFNSIRPDTNIKLAMFRNFTTRFLGKGYEIDGKLPQGADLAHVFLRNNALRTPKDVENAVATFMKAVGFEKVGTSWIAKQSARKDIEEIITSSRQFENYKGLPYATQMQHYVEDALTDLYHVFHGSHDQFNDKLLKHFQPFINGYRHDRFKSMDELDFDTYSNLIEGFTAKDRIFSDLEFDPSLDATEWVRKYGFKAFEAMSRQTDGILRQPVLHMHYLAYRKQYKAAEEAYAKSLLKQSLKSDPTQDAAKAIEKANNMAARLYSEQALSDAAHHVLKYTDNPEFRTVFSHNVRTVGRFYRAVEDFHRRMYRLVRDNGLGTVYRLRLLSQGLASNGFTHQDENGDAFLIMPMDDVIFGAVDTTLRAITGNDVSVHQPLFNDINFKITAGNPSFQTDAGIPYLSGPAGAISVLAIKSLLGKFDPTAGLAEDVDNVALGSYGGNVTLKSAITPKFVGNIWKMLSPDERSAEEVSAYTQAIAHAQANGQGINIEDYQTKDSAGNVVVDTERYNKDVTKFLENTRISAHNIIVLRSLLGMILPTTAQLRDTKDLPDYLKDGQSVSMRTSFYDVLDQVKLKYPNVQDPMELALATWQGKNPGKLAYIVSTNAQDIKPVLSYSNQMQDWALKNRNEVAKYGAAALIFAPKSGEFSPNVWQWANAAGINQKIPANETVGEYINNYFQDVSMKQYVNAYYDLSDQQDAELANVPFTSPEIRRGIVASYESKRKSMKLSVPGLSDYIKNSADNSAEIQFVDNVYQFVSDPSSDIDSESRKKVLEAYQIYQDFVDYSRYVDSVNPDQSPAIKRQEKEKAFNAIKKLASSDSTKAVDQFFSFGLKNLMNRISKTASSSVNRNIG